MQKIDKLNMLKNILAGKIKREDFQPKDFLIKVGYGSGSQFFINGKKINENDFMASLKADKSNEPGSLKVEYGSED